MYSVGFTGKYPDYKDFSLNVWDQYYFKFPIMYGICLILIPLCLIKDISKMRIASLFSIASLIYAIFVLNMVNFLGDCHPKSKLF